MLRLPGIYIHVGRRRGASARTRSRNCVRGGLRRVYSPGSLGATLPTPGSMLRSVAFVDVHESVTASPGLTVAGDALSVTVGSAAAGAGAAAGGVDATFFLQPPTTAAKATNPSNNAILRKLPVYQLPPSAFLRGHLERRDLNYVVRTFAFTYNPYN